jgi:2-dehydropantoate 2-reductase
MKTTVVGGGAMGAMYAAALASHGSDVTVLDSAPAVVDAITEHGIRIRRGTDLETVRVRATTKPAEAAADVVMVFVKAHHTAAVASELSSYIRDDSTVVSLQNGWGNAATLSKAVPPEQLVIGVTYHSCTALEPGYVAHTGQGPTFLGPYGDAAVMDRADTTAALLAAAGFEVTATQAARDEIWKKLVLNAATLPVAALTGLCAGDIGASEDPLALADDLAREAVSVGQARGLNIDLAERLDRIHAVLAAAGKGKPSMLQDVLARRKTEVEVINGAVAAAGHDEGVAVPLNRAMVSLIHGLEGSWSA